MKNKINSWQTLKKSAAQYPLRMTGVAMWVVTLALICIGPIVGIRKVNRDIANRILKDEKNAN